MAATHGSKPSLEDLRSTLELGGEELAVQLEGLLEEVHPADLAGHLRELNEEDARRVFLALADEDRAELLQCADEAQVEALVGRLGTGEIVAVLENMPSDEGVDLLGELDTGAAEAVLHELGPERARDLRALSRHEADTAGGRMSPDFVAVQEGTRIGDAIKAFKQRDEELVEDPTGVYVVDQGGRPLGFLSGHDLLTHSIHERVDSVLEGELFSAEVTEDQEDVAHRILKYGLESLPVIDSQGVLIGVVTADDIQEVLEEEVEEDVLRLVGASPTEQTRLPVLTRVRQRIPLQMLTVAGGLATAWILDAAMGAGDRSSSAELLRYLPIIIGIAGNVGIQSSTILVRAFATGEVSPGREFTVLRGEVSTGALIGLVCGASTALTAAWIESAGGAPAWGFGVAVGVAIAVAVVWASLLGCLVPIFCKRRGADPAVAAGPFLVAINDVSGAAIYMGVAHLVLQGGLAGGGV